MKKLSIALMAAALVAMAAQAEDAATTWAAKCAGCHGKEGKGDTKLGQKLEIRDYSDAKVQATLKDADMFKTIKEGLKKGDKTLMKAYGETLSDADIKALVAHVKSLKK
jgi:cytochrome c553